MTICPAPSVSTDSVYPRCVAAAFCASCLSLDRRRFRSACNLSVPLCLGITRSISSRQAIFSSCVLACLKRCSADIYWGVRLAGITVLLSKSVWRYSRTWIVSCHPHSSFLPRFAWPTISPKLPGSGTQPNTATGGQRRSHWVGPYYKFVPLLYVIV